MNLEDFIKQYYIVVEEFNLNHNHIVFEEYKILVRKIMNKDLYRKGSIYNLSKVVIIIANRMKGIPANTKMLIIKKHDKKGKNSLASLNRLYKNVLKSLNIDKFPKINYIEVFGDQLKYTKKVIIKAEDIYNNLDSVYLNSKVPSIVALSTLYLVGEMEGEHRVQRVVAKIGGCSEVIIRYRVNEIKKMLEKK